MMLALGNYYLCPSPRRYEQYCKMSGTYGFLPCSRVYIGCSGKRHEASTRWRSDGEGHIQGGCGCKANEFKYV